MSSMAIMYVRWEWSKAQKDDDLPSISRTSANRALNPGPLQGPRVSLSQVMLINQPGLSL